MQPKRVLCNRCRCDVTGEAYQWAGHSYCGPHWLELQNYPLRSALVKRCYEKPPTTDR